MIKEGKTNMKEKIKSTYDKIEQALIECAEGFNDGTEAVMIVSIVLLILGSDFNDGDLSKKIYDAAGKEKNKNGI